VEEAADTQIDAITEGLARESQLQADGFWSRRSLHGNARRGGRCARWFPARPQRVEANPLRGPVIRPQCSAPHPPAGAGRDRGLDFPVPLAPVTRFSRPSGRTMLRANDSQRSPAFRSMDRRITCRPDHPARTPSRLHRTNAAMQYGGNYTSLVLQNRSAR